MTNKIITRVLCDVTTHLNRLNYAICLVEKTDSHSKASIFEIAEVCSRWRLWNKTAINSGRIHAKLEKRNIDMVSKSAHIAKSSDSGAAIVTELWMYIKLPNNSKWFDAGPEVGIHLNG